MGEEPLGVSQERALTLHASELLEKGEREHLRVREPLEGLVTPPARVELSVVGVVYEAEEYDHGLFRRGEAWSMVVLGHPLLLWSGNSIRMALFLTHQSAQQTSSFPRWAFSESQRAEGIEEGWVALEGPGPLGLFA